MVICITSLAILAVFFIGAIPKLDFQQFAIDTNGGWFIDGVKGVFYALPFAIWFYLAIEELPLAAEESADPKRDIPRGTMWGLRDAGRHRLPGPLPELGDLARARRR